MTESRAETDRGVDTVSLVGDPIDVVSGANVERTLDFRLVGPLAFEWYRHYDSSRARQSFALGRGHTHSYDHQLVFDLDGVRYVQPLARGIALPLPSQDGGETSAQTYVLRRVSSTVYQVFHRARPTLDFVLPRGGATARLARLWAGDHEIVFEYDDGGRLSGIVDSQRRYLVVRSDDLGRVRELAFASTRAQPERRLVAYAYDAAGNLAGGMDGAGAVFRFEYTSDNLLARRTNRAGYSFLFEYDREGRCTRSCGADGLNDVRLRYDPERRQTIVARADGGEWAYHYGEHGKVERVVDPYGGVRVYVLDGNGSPVQEIDPAGATTNIIASRDGVPLARTDALGTTTLASDDRYAPEPRSHRVPRTAEEWEYGRFLQLSAVVHGMLDRLPSQMRQLAAATALSPEPRQTPPWEVRPLGPRWYPPPRSGRVFDEIGRLVEQRHRAGRTRHWTYDANGNLQEYVDFDGGRYTYERRSWNLRTRETDPNGATTTLEWTRTEQVSATTDPGGTRSEYSYDLKDRLIEVRRNGAVKERYRYDAGDNLIAKLDGTDQPLQEIEVGPAGLPVVRVLASGERQSYEYDEHGRYIAVATDRDRIEFAYDKFGHRAAELRNGTGVEHQYANVWVPRETTVLGRFAIQYQSSAEGERVIRDPTGRETRLARLDTGLLLRTSARDTRELTRFDEVGRVILKAVFDARSTPALWSRSYRYSGEGDLLEEHDSSRNTVRYEYDAGHRLIAWHTGRGLARRISYDAAGNLTGMPGLTGVHVGAGNLLLAANGDTLRYDSRHRVSARHGSQAAEYGYDSRDMLVSCRTARGEWRASYDPLGRRLRAGLAGRETEFYWDTDRLAAEIRFDGSVRVFVYADPLAISPIGFVDYDSLEADPREGRAYSVFTNQVATPVLIQDASGRNVWRAALDPYGTAHVESDSEIEMPLRFPGHYYDGTTGLHYNRFRYYSPELGRYMQPDALGLGGGLNVYAYPASPGSVVDVRGLTCPECEAKAQAAREEKEEIEETQRPVAYIDDDEARAVVAKLAGMDEDHLAALQERAKANGEVIIVRDTNPMSLCHHDDPDAIPKPVTVKEKTDPDTGLVTRDRNPDGPPPDGWHYDDDGVLRNDKGQAAYGDHDLQGVYQKDDDGNMKPAPTNDPAWRDQLNNDCGDPPMYQHGANDDYVKDGKPGRVPGDNESFTAIDENGRASKVGPPLSELRDYYDQKGIPWPYGDDVGK